MKRNHTIVRMMILFIGFLMALETGIARSADNVQKPEWFFGDIVDIEFVKQHLQVPMAETVMIIDSRPKRAKYDLGHIPMALSIPDSEFDEHIEKLPKNKDALLIYYCEGTECKLSHNSAKKAVKLGYTNVKVFAEGFPRWIKEPGHYASVSLEYVKKQIDSGTDMLLVDSRPKRTKFDKGHIPGAVSIPDSEFDQMTTQLPQDKAKLLIFYCEGYQCKLSHKSAQRAIAMGYSNVKVYSAGYPEWVAKFGTSEPGVSQKAPEKLKSGKEEGSIDISSFEKLIKENPESLFLVDVRDADEFAAGSLKTALNIPVDQLKKRIKELPSDKPIVFICGTGARSGESYYMVQDIRPELKNVYYVDAGMTFKKDGSVEIVKSTKN
ncbi:MAG: rhodanese-like domain-containing protein [Thermodesulfobacteriota bacterium]